MTVETKTTIELSDIDSVEFECKHCHSVSAWPLSVARRPPARCHCENSPQWMVGGGDMDNNITRLIELMRRLSEAQKEPFTMRFAIKSAALGDRASRAKD